MVKRGRARCVREPRATNTITSADPMKTLLGIFIALFLMATTSSAAEKVRISGGGMTPLHGIIWVASQEGLFKKYGLEAEYLAMNSGTLGVQTLLSNESQYLFSTGALPITANVQGADLEIITGGFNLYAFKVVGRPDHFEGVEIESAGDYLQIGALNISGDRQSAGGKQILALVREQSLHPQDRKSVV